MKILYLSAICIILVSFAACSSPAATTSQPAPQTATGTLNTKPALPDWTVIDVSAKVTESNTVWWKYAWKLTVRNNRTDRPITLDVKIKFLDKDGFVVDDDDAYNLSVAASSEATFSEYDLIDTEVAGNIASVKAELR
jgi:hypothetical protein